MDDFFTFFYFSQSPIGTGDLFPGWIPLFLIHEGYISVTGYFYLPDQVLRRPHQPMVFPVRAEHRDEFRALMEIAAVAAPRLLGTGEPDQWVGGLRRRAGALFDGDPAA